jgi:hypothetical protein
MVENKMTGAERKRSGTGGTLILFVILITLNIFCIFGLALINLTGIFGNPSILLIFLFAGWFFLGIYGIFTLTLLLSKKNNAQKHTLRWIYCTLVISILNLVFVFFVFNKVEVSTIIVPLLTAGVWLTYFPKSKRVKNMYGVHN